MAQWGQQADGVLGLPLPDVPELEAGSRGCPSSSSEDSSSGSSDDASSPSSAGAEQAGPREM
eukprot:8459683-Lingulodinium_polyedra.AAC.1